MYRIHIQLYDDRDTYAETDIGVGTDADDAMSAFDDLVKEAKTYEHPTPAEAAPRVDAGGTYQRSKLSTSIFKGGDIKGGQWVDKPIQLNQVTPPYPAASVVLEADLRARLAAELHSILNAGHRVDGDLADGDAAGDSQDVGAGPARPAHGGDCDSDLPSIPAPRRQRDSGDDEEDL